MRLPVNVKRLYMVGSQEANTEFRRPHVYQDCPWNQHLWKCGEGSRNRQKGKVEPMQSQALPWPNSWSTWELERLFKSVPSWAQIVQPLYSHINQSLDASCPGKGHDLGRGSFLQLDNAWRGWQLKTIYGQHCQQLGQQILQGRVSGPRITVSTTVGHSSACSKPIEMLRRIYYFKCFLYMANHKKARKGAKSEEGTDRQSIRTRYVSSGNMILSSLKRKLKL